MQRPARRSNSRCSSRAAPQTAPVFRAPGYALLVLMIAVTLLLISLTAVLPDVYTEGQREREEELLFRGNEYARAILLYHIRFNRYPMKVEDLVKGTNGIRFLRHAYPDPMSRDGKWRFIHANVAGVVMDSRTLQTMMNNPQQMAPGGPVGGGFGGGSATGFTLQGGPGNVGGALGTGQTGTGPAMTPPNAEPGTQPQPSSSAFSNSTAGLFIIGVASSSTKKSFRVFNKQTHYDYWEFLAIPALAAGFPGVGPTTTGAPPGGMGGSPAGGPSFPGIPANPSTNQ